jgi:hypothetical protein
MIHRSNDFLSVSKAKFEPSLCNRDMELGFVYLEG